MNRYRIWLFFVAVVITIPVAMGGGIGQAEGQTETATSSSIIDLENEEVNIQLQAQQRTVEHGEPVILTLSAASYVSNADSITVQLIVESSSGVSITGSTAEQGSGNQFSTVTTIDPGSSESVRVFVSPSEPGTYEVTSEIVYFVGDNRETSTGERARISITQTPPPRSALSWTPTILGFIIGGFAATSLLKSSNANAIKRWGRDLMPVWSTLGIVATGCIGVGFAALWFSQYTVLTELSAGEVSRICLFISAVAGIVLTAIGWMGDFLGTVRLGYAMVGMACALAVPIQVIITLFLSIL